MENKEIARQFSLLAALMELHGENAFKTKAYANAYVSLRKWDRPLATMSAQDIAAIPGIGSSVVSKIVELNTTGQIELLESWKSKTPEGIQEILKIKGLGPKKVRQIWDELKVESPAELLYAINENRLISLSGFGLKTQEDLRQKITYHLESAHQVLYGHVADELNRYLKKWKKNFPEYRIEWTGEMARLCPVIDQLSLLISPPMTEEEIAAIEGVVLTEDNYPTDAAIEVAERFSIAIQYCDDAAFEEEWAYATMGKSLWNQLYDASPLQQDETVEAWLERSGKEGLPVELFDAPELVTLGPSAWADLVALSDIKGILHNHSTYSDGMHSLEEMAVYIRDQGYEYFGICDHSRSAFYAQGLQIEKVLAQMDEIDALNGKLAPFRIFKGIESDILNDGALDYEEDILKKFDFIVASVHSNLRMDEDKAMRRLITAIENPYTRILGHPTGRLLLARQGYPIDHRKIIDACAANGVAIELNANPQRLDIDYQWMQYCMEKEVWVSINPDAHSRGQVDFVKYGVIAARKGGLKKTSCLNALPLAEFDHWILSGKK